MTALDLPIKRQKELAELMNMSHAEWIEDTKKALAECDEFLRKLHNDELEDTGMTPEDIARVQAKMDEDLM